VLIVNGKLQLMMRDSDQQLDDDEENVERQCQDAVEDAVTERAVNSTTSLKKMLSVNVRMPLRDQGRRNPEGKNLAS